jgi:hypothetical protein
MRKLKYFCVKAGGTGSQLPLRFERFLFVSTTLFETSFPAILEVLRIPTQTNSDSWEGSDLSKIKLQMTTQKNTNNIQFIT